MWKCKYCDTYNSDEDSFCLICDKSRRYNRVLTLTKRKVNKLGLVGDTIVIPEKFNIIGKEAFMSRTDITTVVLHPAVRKIAKCAFYGCINLKEVRTLGKISSIGSKAFGNCLALSMSSRPSANRYTADDAFYVSSELHRIDDMIFSLNQYIQRYKQIELSQHNRGIGIKNTENKIIALDSKVDELRIYKSNLARGIADSSQMDTYSAFVSAEKNRIVIAENSEATAINEERERARAEAERRALEKENKRKKRNLVIGLSVGGAAICAIVAVLLIVLL